MSMFFRVIVGIVNLPLYYIAYCIPKKRTLWLFSSQQGRKYSENSKYIFEHITENHDEISAYWVTKSLEVAKRLQKSGHPVVYAYSLKGYYLSARAGYVFYSHFRRECSDYNDYVTTSKTHLIQLWHGSPLKKIGALHPQYDKEYLNSINRRLAKIVFPFYKSRTSCNKFLAASYVVAEDVKEAFHLKDEHIWISGYPKNDLWLADSKKHEKTGKVLFMPTWRTIDSSIFSRKYEFDSYRLDSTCEDLGLQFHIKLHSYDSGNIFIKNEVKHLKNIHLVDCDDIYDVLGEYEILITDYSSIIFDYLLADKPLIFTPFDLQSYISADADFLHDYELISECGIRAYHWPELEGALSGDHSIYQRKRDTIRNMFNKNTSTHSCEDLYKLVNEHMKNESYGNRAYHY
jgi:CDP-glycerol glycerophosphotransferase (TagB/SpsB family)